MNVDDQPLIYETDGPVAWITLNRPHVLNAMNHRLHSDLTRALEAMEHDDDVWIGVVQSAGDRAFSVGQDLKELAAADDPPVSSFGSAGKPGAPRLTDRFDLTKPLIARVQGLALGGGFELAMACDLVLAGRSATFALPEAQLGLIAGAGGLFRLSRQVPPRIALGLALTGRSLTAEQAASWGLVNEVYDDDRLDHGLRQWLDELLAGAPLAMRAAKQALWRGLDLPLPDAFAATYPAEELRKHSEDALEGPRAFAEKRPPQWRAR